MDAALYRVAGLLGIIAVWMLIMWTTAKAPSCWHLPTREGKLCRSLRTMLWLHVASSTGWLAGYLCGTA